MEMLDWFGEDVSENKDKSITKMELSPPKDEDKWTNPEIPDIVTANIQINGGETITETWTIGEEECHAKLPRAVAFCILKCCASGKTEFKISPNTKFNRTDEDLVFVIEITEHQKEKRDWEIADEDKISTAESYKPRAAELIKSGHFESAKAKYDFILKILSVTPEKDAENYAAWSALKVSILSNLGLIAIKTKTSF